MPTSIELDPMMMREIIVDHYNAPRHKGDCPDLTVYKTTHSSSVNCIDDIDVFLKEEDGKIVDALWNGTACAISTASTDILCDLLIGQTKEQAEVIIAEYTKMITGEEEYDASVLDEALAFMNTHRQPSRIHCATIGWDAFKSLLDAEDHHE
ncbi:MAG: SUF system NifU family Fe-S cluster assembly protein [Candidatus Enteromonas sp.]|nr:SUF system NifU family Fe-S cluster assembly protein [Candidatus Enteromonas sp.]